MWVFAYILFLSHIFESFLNMKVFLIRPKSHISSMAAAAKLLINCSPIIIPNNRAYGSTNSILKMTKHFFFNEVMKIKWVWKRFSDHSTHFYDRKKKFLQSQKKKEKKMVIMSIFFSFSEIAKNFSSRQINIFLPKEQPRRVSGGGFVAIINSSMSCHIFHTSFKITPEKKKKKKKSRNFFFLLNRKFHDRM